MRQLTRRSFTAAGIVFAASLATGCGYDPKDNVMETVYGPPEDYDATENEPEPVYGPPEDYDASDNMLVDVYGPPEDFDSAEESASRTLGTDTDAGGA